MGRPAGAAGGFRGRGGLEPGHRRKDCHAGQNSGAEQDPHGLPAFSVGQPGRRPGRRF